MDVWKGKFELGFSAGYVKSTSQWQMYLLSWVKRDFPIQRQQSHLN